MTDWGSGLWKRQKRKSIFLSASFRLLWIVCISSRIFRVTRILTFGAVESLCVLKTMVLVSLSNCLPVVPLSVTFIIFYQKSILGNLWKAGIESKIFWCLHPTPITFTQCIQTMDLLAAISFLFKIMCHCFWMVKKRHFSPFDLFFILS